MNQRVSNTLCWKCARACGGCSWSQEFKPVEGWEATPSKVRRCEGGFIDSYIVHNCPMFEKERFGFIEPVTRLELAKLLDVSVRTISRWSEDDLEKQLNAIGLSFKVKNSGSGNRKFYVFKKRETKVGIFPVELAKEMGIDINSHRYYRKTNIFGIK